MLNEFGSKLTAPDHSVEHKMTCLERKGRGLICVNAWSPAALYTSTAPSKPVEKKEQVDLEILLVER